METDFKESDSPSKTPSPSKSQRNRVILPYSWMTTGCKVRVEPNATTVSRPTLRTGTSRLTHIRETAFFPLSAWLVAVTTAFPAAMGLTFPALSTEAMAADAEVHWIKGAKVEGYSLT